MRVKEFLIVLVSVCLALHSALAQTPVELSGNYPVSESYSVTLQLGTGSSIRNVTYRDTETGTLAITNGAYDLINKSGADLKSISRTIYTGFDGEGGYSVYGATPFSAILEGDGGTYAEIRLTFFVIKIPLPSSYGFSLGDGDLSSNLDVSGTSLSDLSGTGSYVDGNAPDYTLNYINEVDVSSTAGLVFPPVAPAIISPPISQVVQVGSDVTLSVAASGNPPPSFKWEHNGKAISSSGEFGGASTATLSINNAQPKDAGTYTVVASNSKGSATASAVLTVVAAPIFTNLYSFTNGNDGGEPVAGLLLSGNTLYGTTFYGGNFSNSSVFAVNTNGTSFDVLYDFTNGLAGSRVESGLILSGNTLYGTTSQGGASGHGTIFSVSTGGASFTTLYEFTNGADGAEPVAGLILSGHTLYGTASQGGASSNGTIFVVNADGSDFATLYTFSPTDTNGYNSDGATPSAGLILSGNTLYGTASGGGASGEGTVFTLQTNGTGFRTLHNFTALSGSSGSFGTSTNTDGANPSASLLLSGNTLFGTTINGGNGDSGTIFSVSVEGADFAALYEFSATDTNGFNTDGANPYGGLVASGNTLYGAALGGGSSGEGTVFMVGTKGTGFALLHSFTAGTDGGQPQGGLILAGSTLYGTAAYGGSSDHGTVFGISVAFGVVSGPQIKLQPQSNVVAVGKTVSFSVSATGATSLTYQWQLDGTNLSNGHGISGATTSKLVISAVGAANDGQYSVVVSDENGSTQSASASLTVDSPPKIVSQPLKQTIAAGTSANLYVAATGSALTYHWKHANTNLSDNETYTGSATSNLFISNAQIAQAGAYEVVVTNAVGSATSSSATLTVDMPPSITSQPASESIAVGGTATFSVKATGTAPLHYQWRSNGVSIHGATTDQLTLKKLQAAEGGAYAVVISNLVGQTVSSNAVLTVAGASPADLVHQAEAGDQKAVPVVVASQPVITSAQILPDGTIKFTISGTSAPALIIQSSHTLLPGTWVNLSTNSVANGRVNFTDTNASRDQSRFYRALLPP